MSGFRGGGVSVSQDGTNIGRASRLNFVAGAGLQPTVSSSGGLVSVQDGLVLPACGVGTQGGATISSNYTGLGIPATFPTALIDANDYDTLGNQLSVGGFVCQVAGIYAVQMNVGWRQWTGVPTSATVSLKVFSAALVPLRTMAAFTATPPFFDASASALGYPVAGVAKLAVGERVNVGMQQAGAAGAGAELVLTYLTFTFLRP